MTGLSSAEVDAMVDRHGWGPGLERVAAEAPSLPQSGIDFLRADGFPSAGNHGSVQPRSESA